MVAEVPPPHSGLKESGRGLGSPLRAFISPLIRHHWFSSCFSEYFAAAFLAFWWCSSPLRLSFLFLPYNSWHFQLWFCHSHWWIQNLNVQLDVSSSLEVPGSSVCPKVSFSIPTWDYSALVPIPPSEKPMPFIDRLPAFISLQPACFQALTIL